MYDAGKIIPALLIFLVLVTTPIWYGLARGQDSTAPVIVKPTNADSCVEDTEWMRREHMQLVMQWRDESVRDGQRIYVNSKGERFYKSLTGTCLGCHTDKSASCDRCHDYLSVKPYCWDCHVVPGGGE
jgi:hypothetical protein